MNVSHRASLCRREEERLRRVKPSLGAAGKRARAARPAHEQVAECMRQGKRAQAMALITEVIKSNPTDAEAYMNRGSVQTSLGEVELAISDFTTAIHLDPNLAPAWYNRGTTLAHVGRYESAIADFTEAMRLQPDFPLAYCNRGLAKTELGRYDEALADYTKAIEQDPNSTNCYFSRGTLSRDGRIPESD
jgi:tetratricopeptide (TPR) repeat protein